MTIGVRIKSERERMGLSQTAFGALGGAGKTTVIAWERGTSTPTAGFLEEAGKAGADVQFIVTGIRSTAALAADEQVLLDGYRALDPGTRRRMLAFMLGGGDPASGQAHKSKTVNVTSQSAGRDIKN